jgi:hypothetical protein
MTYDDLNEARNKLFDLKLALEKLHDRDPDQEVWEIAYRPIDAALMLAAKHVGDDSVVREVRELFSPGTVADGRVVRVADILPVVSMLAGILGRRVGEMALDEPGATRRRRATGQE